MAELRQYESDCVVKVMKDINASSTKTMDDGTDDMDTRFKEMNSEIKAVSQSMEDKMNEILKYISTKKET